MRQSEDFREKKSNRTVFPISQSSSRGPPTISENGSTIETTSNRSDSARPPWNSSTAARQTKTPKSVFLGIPTNVRRSSTKQSENHSPVQINSMPVEPTVESKFIRVDPQVVVVETEKPKNAWRKLFQTSKTSGHHDFSENPSVYRGCTCCARGRLASACPSCYFCELFYGCPLYCWLLTLLLVFIPMLIVFGWLLSEQPALNVSKRRYITQQSSIYQNEVYAVMHNCATPYCTNASPATTINQLYLTYREYAVTQVTSGTVRFSNFALLFILTLFEFLNFL